VALALRGGDGDLVSTATIYCGDRTVREVNREIKQHLVEGIDEIEVADPAARHNLGVGLIQPVTLRFAGSVGYYCAGLGDGPDVAIAGSAGWGVAEGMMSGIVVVEGDAGNGAGAAMRGGTLVVKGDAGARAGVSMKGGLLLIGGDCGYMTGFMGQKGTIIVCGDAGEALGDSMYETVIYVGGAASDLGSDAVIEPVGDAEAERLTGLAAAHGLRPRDSWKMVRAGRRLWNFDKRDDAWRAIL
jgi:glutamate synthase domain-containing protein 3